MATLHTVNKSPFANQALLSCLNHTREGDAILMIEDGVYGATAGTGLAEALRGRSDVKLYVLEPDLKARGIDSSRLLEGVEAVDYAGFVELAATTDRTMAWL